MTKAVYAKLKECKVKAITVESQRFNLLIVFFLFRPLILIVL